MSYSVTLKNTDGLRLTIFVKNTDCYNGEQPYDAAERIVNSDPQHMKYGTFTAWRTERAT